MEENKTERRRGRGRETGEEIRRKDRGSDRVESREKQKHLVFKLQTSEGLPAEHHQHFKS